MSTKNVSVALAILCLVWAVGCGGKDKLSQVVTNPVAQPVLYSYISGTFANAAVIAFVSMDPQTGTLSKTATVTNAGGTATVITDPFDRFLFVTRYYSGIDLNPPLPRSTLAFPIDSRNKIVSEPSSTFADAPPQTRSAPAVTGGAVRVHPSGKFVYLVKEPSGQTSLGAIDAWAIPAAAEGFKRLAGAPYGQNVYDIQIDPAGKFLYATVVDTTGVSSLQIFSIDPTTGALSFTVSEDIPTGSIQFHPNGKFAYILPLTNQSAHIALYSVDTGTGKLTFLGSQFAAAGLASLTIHPSAKFMYATGWLTDITKPLQSIGFQINETSGALTQISMGDPACIVETIEKGGRFAYSAENLSVLVCSIDPSTGALNPRPDLALPLSDVPLPPNIVFFHEEANITAAH